LLLFYVQTLSVKENMAASFHSGATAFRAASLPFRRLPMAAGGAAPENTVFLHRRTSCN
jgi:hypothetical protein